MSKHEQEWFDQPDPTGRTDSGEVGLRFTCTQCGSCCTGPTGYVLFNDKEAGSMAKTLGISKQEFLDEYSHDTILGRSLNENLTDFGYDCIFLTRDAKTGKAGCSIYEARPEQCRTWPFWDSNLTSKRAWASASRKCPGMDTGTRYPPQHIRITRDRVEI